MKGLLLKDLYMMKAYCRIYLFITVVFIAVSFVSDNNLFLVFYPCMLCGMIPVNLLGYDERSRWLQYSATLPYTKAQLVSCKYLIGLFAQTAVLLATGIVQGLRMSLNGGFQANDFAVIMFMMLIIATISSSVCLPFIFKLGVEKGRTAYYVMVGIVCGGSVVASNLFLNGADLQVEITPTGILPLLCLAGIGLYVFSWYMSIVFYKKREL